MENEITSLKAKIDEQAAKIVGLQSKLEQANRMSDGTINNLRRALVNVVKTAHTIGDKTAEQLLSALSDSIDTVDYVELLKEAEVVMFDFEYDWIIEQLLI